MNGVFVRVLNMSAAGAVVIAAILILRLLLRKAPKNILCLLWLLAALRLAVPVSFSSGLSVFNLGKSEGASSGSIEYFQSSGESESSILEFEPPRILPGQAMQSEAFQPRTANTMPLTTLAVLWLTGVGVLLLYAVMSYWDLRAKLRAAARLRENIWLCDEVESPFILGTLRPRIYLPSDMGEGYMEPVIAHEKAHICRGDHVWKLLGYILLAAHWFNPLVWLGYVLFCRDIELACDERAVRGMDAGEVAAYSRALIACSLPQKAAVLSPLAFGEVGLKTRLKAVLNNKKPALWVIIAAVAALAAVGVFFLTDPVARPELTEEELANEFIDDTLRSLVPHSDGTVSFELPGEIPKVGGANTELTISLGAEYSDEPGSSSYERILDRQTNWSGGETFERVLETDRGKLVALNMWIAFMTENEATETYTSYTYFAANGVTLSAPFNYDTPTFIQTADVTVSKAGERTVFLYELQNGERVKVSMEFPEDFDFTPTRSDPGRSLPPTLEISLGGEIVGEITPQGLGTPDPAVLETVDTAKNELPMPVFSRMAMAIHVGYKDDYKVLKSWLTGAAATVTYRWQDLVNNPPPAAGIPDQYKDCILAYDYEAMPYYLQFTLEEGVLDRTQIAAAAASVTIAKK